VAAREARPIVSELLRNIAIVAHVDHGKTTLVDQMLRQSDTLDARFVLPERAMDSNALERERGITILAKNTALRWKEWRINVVDTPGHQDFGGEVERVLSMVDAILLVVDAVDGPMPQTRFVTEKAIARGLRLVVAINKMDRAGRRPGWVLDETFDLVARLGGSEEQLDFPIVYVSALEGWASREPEVRGRDLAPLFETVVTHVPPPRVDATGPLQLQVSALDRSNFTGTIGIGRIARGRVRQGDEVLVVGADGSTRAARVQQLWGFLGLERVPFAEALAGDIVAFSGAGRLHISDTLCDPARPEALPALEVEEPTVEVAFEVNTSPFAGREGQFVTSRHLRERLERELLANVALRVRPTEDPDRFLVAGRGELHLGVLMETMRREGYEFAVARPRVLLSEEGGTTLEPIEWLTLDLDEAYQGAVMEALGTRGASLENLQPDGRGRIRLEFRIPTRGLLGFHSAYRMITAGTGLLHHRPVGRAPLRPLRLPARAQGALISNGTGAAVAYALFNLQERGRLLVAPGEAVYEGQVIGFHVRENDLTVNPLRAKELTNIRAAGRDENILLTPPLRLGIEAALELLADDELLEITPESLRLRKRLLSEGERRRGARAKREAS
jgi:GTP-binding protein